VKVVSELENLSNSIFYIGDGSAKSLLSADIFELLGLLT